MTPEILEIFYPLYVEVDMFGSVIILVLIFRLIVDSRIRGQREFRRLLIWEVILFMSEAMSRITQDYRADFTDSLVMIAKSVYFISCVASSCACFSYFECCRDSALSHRCRFKTFSSIPLYFYIALVILNLYGKFLFEVNDEGLYQRGPAFNITYVLCYFYAAVISVRSFADAFRKENYADRGYFILLGVFPVVPGIAGVFQYSFSNIPVLCPAMTIFSILIYIDAMEQLIYTDPLTSLDNRRSFTRELVTMMKNQRADEKLYFAMIDLNNFKSINDTYGHNAGDSALVIVADPMRQSADSHRNRLNLCRYGGDEFAVILSSDDRMEIRRYLRDVLTQIEVLVKERHMPCPVTFSAGVSEWNGKDEPGEFIENADKEMYVVKSERRSSQ